MVDDRANVLVHHMHVLITVMSINALREVYFGKSSRGAGSLDNAGFPAQTAEVVPTDLLAYTPYFPRDQLSAVANLEQVAATSEAVAIDVRDAVSAARLMGVPWSVIGEALTLSRQAVSERFGGELRVDLTRAWQGVEVQLWQLAELRGGGPPLACLRRLVEEGQLSLPMYETAAELFRERARAIHDPRWSATLDVVEDLTDRAIPLIAALYVLRNAEPRVG